MRNTAGKGFYHQRSQDTLIMKRILAFAVLILSAAVSFTSCEETKEIDDQANWESRNNQYVKDIAARCALSQATVETAREGQMFRLLSYKLDPEKNWTSPYTYVYCEVLASGQTTASPFFTDSVRVNYRVRLIPTDNYPQGQVIDQSYKTEKLDPSVNIPASFKVSSLVEGVSTALMYMHAGDSWRITIPYQLGYGKTKRTGIPAYSTLIFEMNLTEFVRTGADLPPL